MDDTDYPHPTLRHLAMELGEVQIQWCFLENDMRRQCLEAGLGEKTTKGSIGHHWRSLWRSDCDAHAEQLEAVEALAKSRNLLAHGIQSVSANPWKAESAVVVCRDPAGVSHEFTIQMLRDLARDIAKRRALFSRFVVSTGGVR